LPTWPGTGWRTTFPPASAPFLDAFKKQPRSAPRSWMRWNAFTPMSRVYGFRQSVRNRPLEPFTMLFGPSEFSGRRKMKLPHSSASLMRHQSARRSPLSCRLKATTTQPTQASWGTTHPSTSSLSPLCSHIPLGALINPLTGILRSAPSSIRRWHRQHVIDTPHQVRRPTRGRMLPNSRCPNHQTSGRNSESK